MDLPLISENLPISNAAIWSIKRKTFAGMTAAVLGAVGAGISTYLAAKDGDYLQVALMTTTTALCIFASAFCISANKIKRLETIQDMEAQQKPIREVEKIVVDPTLSSEIPAALRALQQVCVGNHTDARFTEEGLQAIYASVRQTIEQILRQKTDAESRLATMEHETGVSLGKLQTFLNSKTLSHPLDLAASPALEERIQKIGQTVTTIIQEMQAKIDAKIDDGPSARQITALLQARLTEETDAKETLQQNIKRLTQEKGQFSARINELEFKLTQASTDAKKYQERIKTLIREKGQLSTQLRNAESENNTLIQRTIPELKERIRKLQQELTNKNLILSGLKHGGSNGMVNSRTHSRSASGRHTPTDGSLSADASAASPSAFNLSYSEVGREDGASGSPGFRDGAVALNGLNSHGGSPEGRRYSSIGLSPDQRGNGSISHKDSPARRQSFGSLSNVNSPASPERVQFRRPRARSGGSLSTQGSPVADGSGAASSGEGIASAAVSALAGWWKGEQK